jgi:kynurenine formamidase
MDDVVSQRVIANLLDENARLRQDASQCQPCAGLFVGKSFVDCTQTINPNAFTFCQCFFKSSEKCDTRPPDGEIGGFRKEIYQLGCDVGTHIDSPIHFIPGGRAIHQLTLQELIAHGAVIDVSSKCAHNHDYELTVQDVTDFEARFGRIPDKALVVMKTGWGSKFALATGANGYNNPYIGAREGDDNTGHFPGFHADAAQFLLDYREIVGIGIDTASLDYGMSATFPVHVKILGADKYQIENMDLSSCPEGMGMTFMALPIKVEGGPEAGARVVAVVGQ